MLVEGMSSVSPPSLSTVTINGNFLQGNGTAPIAKPNLVTVVKVGSPPQWGEDARQLTSFQTFPRSHSRTASASESPVATNDFSLNALSEIKDGVSIITVVIPLANGDRRFGFSVIGGIDERFAPKIEAINAGSPADRADIEVGDEILEVNGKSIEQCTHTEVISHIHQCIRSRCICLKVRRARTSKDHVSTTPSTNGAPYLSTAVKLPPSPTTDSVIRPFDVETLPSVIDAPPPVGFTSDDVLPTSSGASQLLSKAQSLLRNGIVQHNIQHSIDDNTAVPIPQAPHSDVTPSKQVISPLALPVPSPRRSSEKLINRPFIPTKLDLTQPPTASQSTAMYKNLTIDLPPKSPLSGETSPPLSPFKEDSITGLSLMRPTLELSSGTHREMAVDVPDAFVPMAKQAPRYPPTRPSSDTLQRNTDVPKEKNARSLRCNGNGNITSPQTPQEQQMEMFLRSSIRQSKKLRELAKNPISMPSRGVVNDAFEHDNGSHHVAAVQLPLESQPTVDVTKLYDVTVLQTALSRVIDYVGKDGSFDEGQDVDKIIKLLDTEEFQGCLAITNIIKQILCSQAAPLAPARCDAKEICDQLAAAEDELKNSPVGQELLTILSDVNVSHLIECHDSIAKIFGAPKEPVIDDGRSSSSSPVVNQEHNIPAPTPVPSASYTRRVIQPPPDMSNFLDEGEKVNIVQIDKTVDPLGATVRNEGESIIVGRIVKGGAAEKSGLLREGDEIVAVNGVEMRGKSVAQVSDELAKMQGKLTFVIIPNDRYSIHSDPQSQPTVMHLKALFDYDPDDDMYIPCRELGIAFEKGDILHVINIDDPNWWQAHKDGEDESNLAGLIPSRSFQIQREALRQQLMNQNEERNSQRGKKFLCTPTIAKKSLSMKSSRKNSKGKMYSPSQQSLINDEEPLPYEEVGLYYPRAHCKRPVVLIGPSNIGKHELRERLMEDTTRFTAAIPHTSRPRQDHENEGVDYHFISRAQFENDILNSRFVEHGEYEKNYYGTSVTAIRDTVTSGRICVLNLHPESLKILRRSDLKPYVIFIAPPSLEKLRQNRVKVGASVKTEELKEIIEKAREMEEKYGALFDTIIINHDQERAFREVVKEIAFIEREPQWVPKDWIDNE